MPAIYSTKLAPSNSILLSLALNNLMRNPRMPVPMTMFRMRLMMGGDAYRNLMWSSRMVKYASRSSGTAQSAL